MASEFVGSEKCGTCHAAEFKTWQDSYHAKMVRTPQEALLKDALDNWAKDSKGNAGPTKGNIDGKEINWGDTHHPAISETEGKYDGQFLFINDKANTRVARIRLDIMKCDKMITVPNCQAIHGLRLQKVPYTKYVFANAEYVIPHPNDGKVFDLEDENSYTLYNVIDAEKMEMAFQIIVDGNLDNTDADYSGRYAAATCYNSEKAFDLGGMMRNERDWVVVFHIERAEAAVKAIPGVESVNAALTAERAPSRAPQARPAAGGSGVASVTDEAAARIRRMACGSDGGRVCIGKQQRQRYRSGGASSCALSPHETT